MIENRFRVEPADWHVDERRLRAVREAVFVEEQSVPEEDEWDDHDPVSRHVLALDLEEKPIGTARLTPDGGIGRMAVVKTWRGKGVGAAMMQCLMDLARNLGLHALNLHSQTHAIGFYQQYGFEAEGPQFDECGIPHQKMARKLTPFAPRTDPGEAPPPPSEEHETESSDDVLDAVRALINDAHLTVDVYSRDLEQRIYGQGTILRALRDFLVGHDRRRARFLVQDPEFAVKHGHLLFQMHHRLPSRCAIRKVSRDYLDYHSGFVIVDQQALLFREFDGRYEGVWNRYEPFRARELLRYFDEVWAHSVEDPDLRRLDIS